MYIMTCTNFAHLREMSLSRVASFCQSSGNVLLSRVHQPIQINPKRRIAPCYNCTPKHRRIRGGGLGVQPPRIFQIAMFGQKKKNHVIFGQNHLIFLQAMDKIFGQLISAPPPP